MLSMFSSHWKTPLGDAGPNWQSALAIVKVLWPAYLLALTGGGGSSIERVIQIWVSEAPALWLYIELDPSPPSPQALLQLPRGNLIPCKHKVPLSESRHDCHSVWLLLCWGSPGSGLDPVFMAPPGDLPSSHTLMPACSGAGFPLPPNLVVWVAGQPFQMFSSPQRSKLPVCFPPCTAGVIFPSSVSFPFFHLFEKILALPAVSISLFLLTTVFSASITQLSI